MTKHEKITEMAKLIRSVKLYGDDNYERKISYDSALELAKYFYNAEYRKIPKDTVVLTKEECEHKVILDEDHFERALNYERENVRKETAKEILQKIKEKCKELEDKFSHICKSKKECLMETCRYEGVLAVKRELYELAKEYGVEVEE